MIRNIDKLIIMVLLGVSLVLIMTGIGITVDYENNIVVLKDTIENKNDYIYKLNEDIIAYNIEVENYKDTVSNLRCQIDNISIELDSINEELILAKIKLERIKEYNRIAAQDNNIKYLRGWINRVLNN